MTTLLKATTLAVNRFSGLHSDLLLEMVIAYGLKGRLRLQTCANDISFIANHRYEGVLSVYAANTTFGAALAPCVASQNNQDVLIGSRYAKSDAQRASDNRRLTPFPYMSWRVQKDRLAHKFLPLAYSDYDVTAAVTQTWPYPEPQGTYGGQLIVWKKEIVPFCTFKVSDSGRPTRSFLLLLDDLLALAVDRNDSVGKLGVLNLLLQAFVPDAETRLLLADFIQNDLEDFTPKRPKRGVDIEAHLYGDLRLADVDVILYPSKANAVAATRQTVTQLFGVTPVILYDEDKFAARDNDMESNHGEQAYTAVMAVGQLQFG